MSNQPRPRARVRRRRRARRAARAQTARRSPQQIAHAAQTRGGGDERLVVFLRRAQARDLRPRARREPPRARACRVALGEGHERAFSELEDVPEVASFSDSVFESPPSQSARRRPRRTRHASAGGAFAVGRALARGQVLAQQREPHQRRRVDRLGVGGGGGDGCGARHRRPAPPEQRAGVFFFVRVGRRAEYRAWRRKRPSRVGRRRPIAASPVPPPRRASPTPASPGPCRSLRASRSPRRHVHHARPRRPLCASRKGTAGGRIARPVGRRRSAAGVATRGAAERLFRRRRVEARQTFFKAAVAPQV